MVIRLRTIIFVGALFLAWLFYLLPWALTATIGLGLLIGWAISKLLGALS